MLFDTMSLRGRLVSAGRAGRGALRHLVRGPLAGFQHKGVVVEQLLLTPRDLRTADPSFASEIYHGHFGLAGAVAMTGSESPFEIVPPSRAWEADLHGFGWLRHLSAAADEISREHARALVGDWMRLHGRGGGIAWEPEIVARRIISWTSHSRIFLSGSEQRFYENVMISLTRQLRYLHTHWRDTGEGVPRVTALAALVMMELCSSDSLEGPSRAVRQFAEELDRQVLADGGHVTRNPGGIVDMLLDLLPLRQCFIARDRPPPEKLIGAIDRMMPMLRFFRLGDGGLAHFNGTGATETDTLAAVLAHDDAYGKPMTLSEPSGFCRLTAGDTVALVDCGHPPPVEFSGSAHAGCLAFEMSNGTVPIIVNCGAPAWRYADWRLAARATAAHSTVTVCDASSSQLLGSGAGDSDEDTFLVGPGRVTAALETSEDGTVLRAAHDGYDQRFGLTHARKLTLSSSGETLIGEDTLTAPHGLKGDARDNGGGFALRFHIHPAVELALAEDELSVGLLLPDGSEWQLVSRGIPFAIEDSVFLADIRGPRRALQVVIYGTMGSAAEKKIGWVLGKCDLRETPSAFPAGDEADEPPEESALEPDDGPDEVPDDGPA